MSGHSPRFSSRSLSGSRARDIHSRPTLIHPPERPDRFCASSLRPIDQRRRPFEQPKRIRLEAADLDRLIVNWNVAAVPAIDHAVLKLIAPPVSGLRAAARGVFPFSFARQSIRLSSGFREPRDILPCIAPAYVCNRRIVFPCGRKPARFCGGAGVPFLHGDGNFPIANGLTVTCRIGFSVTSSLLPMAKLPPRSEIISSSRIDPAACVAG